MRGTQHSRGDGRQPSGLGSAPPASMAHVRSASGGKKGADARGGAARLDVCSDTLGPLHCGNGGEVAQQRQQLDVIHRGAPLVEARCPLPWRSAVREGGECRRAARGHAASNSLHGGRRARTQAARIAAPRRTMPRGGGRGLRNRRSRTCHAVPLSSGSKRTSSSLTTGASSPAAASACA
eukprot:288791-Prymnesium_polylepis.1